MSASPDSLSTSQTGTSSVPSRSSMPWPGPVAMTLRISGLVMSEISSGSLQLTPSSSLRR